MIYYFLGEHYPTEKIVFKVSNKITSSIIYMYSKVAIKEPFRRQGS